MSASPVNSEHTQAHNTDTSSRDPNRGTHTPNPTGTQTNNGTRREARRNSGQMHPMGDIFNARNQLSEVFFRRVATGYARVFPLTARRVIEFGFLLQAFFVLIILIYLHSMFVRSPITCLDKLRSQPVLETDSTSTSASVSPTTERNHYAPGDSSSPHEPWPRYGILRIEVIRNPSPTYSLEDSYIKEFYGSAVDHGDEVHEFLGLGETVSESSWSTTGTPVSPPTTSSQTPFFRQKLSLHDPKYLWNTVRSFPLYIFHCAHEMFDLILSLFSMQSTNSPSSQTTPETYWLAYDFLHFKHNIFLDGLSYIGAFIAGVSSTATQFLQDVITWFRNLHVSAHEEYYILEYALEYGFLRLSPAIRKRLNITVKLVILDPDLDTCFGGPLSRFLMDEFLGYDDLLLGSIKHLASSESVRGHMANVVTGQHYRLVSAQMSRSSYLVALLVMLLFTFCVSTILRYSTHQLVLVIADILQLFETNVAVGIPATPFLTVILALVAIETIMSEFFGDSFTAFYVILIVSICDHFEAIFCRTEISRRYWPRFFYLYHFAFYAYHHRFNGQFSSMALWVSWLFTLHSMIYFFHHYELPTLVSGWELRDVLTQIASEGHVIRSIQFEVRRQHTSWSGSLEVLRRPSELSNPDPTVTSNEQNSIQSDTNELVNRDVIPPETSTPSSHTVGSNGDLWSHQPIETLASCSTGATEACIQDEVTMEQNT